MVSLFGKPKHQPNRLVHVYASQPAHQFIITPMYINRDEIYYEQETPIVLPFDIHREVIGKHIASAFHQFTMKDRNLRDMKATDWPSFQISRASSIKQFEKLYVVMIIGEENTAIRIDGHPIHSSDLMVSKWSTMSDHLQCGNDVVDVVRCCLHLTETYFI